MYLSRLSWVMALIISLITLQSNMLYAQSVQHSPLHFSTVDARQNNNTFSTNELQVLETFTDENISTIPCKSDEVMQAYLEKNNLKEAFAASYQEMINSLDFTSGNHDKVQYTIPVVFHVVYNTTAQNVSYSDIIDIFDQLNDDYQLQNTDQSNARSQYGFTPANVDISFCLAQTDPSGNPLTEVGVHRVQSSVSYFDPDLSTNDMKYTSSGGTEAWDRTSYMNVWICNISNGLGYGTAGYAYLPTSSILPPSDIDGIVIDYDMGLDLSNRVLTHEVGHYLGLPHTWGSSSNGSGCTDGNDGITDTPITAGPSFNYTGSCSGNQETCTGTQTQYENFMDYSNCYCMFTEDQATVMRNILATSRSSLASSDVCAVASDMPPTANFSADMTYVGEGTTVNFYDLSTNSPTSWSWSISPATGWSFANSTSATSQNPQVTFNAAGTYSVTLEATNTNGSDMLTKTNYITVISGTVPVGCDTLRNYTNLELSNAAYYTLTGESGYYPGCFTLSSGTITTEGLAEEMYVADSSMISGLRFVMYVLDDNGAASSIDFKVYGDNNGSPGTVLATENVDLSALAAPSWNVITFSDPPKVQGTFWIGAEWSTSGSFDTLSFATTNFADRVSGVSSSAVYVNSTYGWMRTSDLFTTTPDASLIFDAIYAGEPLPEAHILFSANEICVGSPVTVSSLGSSNATSFEWSYTDGTDVYASSNDILNFDSLDVGEYTFQLIAHGSCVSDVVSAILSVDNSISYYNYITDDNCGLADGLIQVNNIEGGSGSNYSVSVDNGTNYLTEAPYHFTGLVAGDYSVIVKDQVCSDTSVLTVEAGTELEVDVNPSTNITIDEGESVNLSVDGGISWEWFVQGETTPFATGNSVNVSPLDTIVYEVVATANNCTESILITVNVNPTVGLDEVSWGQSFHVYPNPSAGIFNLDGTLSNAQELEINVVNVLGKKVASYSIEPTHQFSKTINLSSFENGPYFIKVKGKFGVYNSRIIITK